MMPRLPWLNDGEEAAMKITTIALAAFFAVGSRRKRHCQPYVLDCFA
jgi:hypothetical protein